VKRAPSNGFTLIEVILSASIFALVATITWGSLHATFRTEQLVTERTELQEVGTALLNKIREDLAQTFLVEAPRALTFFRGEDNLDHDRLTFSALAHYPSRPEARESEQTQITYETESNPSEPHLFLLKRKETTFLDGTDSVEAESVALTGNLVSFNLEYGVDSLTWKPAWDSRSVDQLNKIPKMVRLSMKLRDVKGREESFETMIDLPMSEGIGITGQQQTRPQTTPSPGPSSGGRQPRPPGRPGTGGGSTPGVYP
jgi:prepilin-type N-terminal cleavage/methylation domain-containing protein